MCDNSGHAHRAARSEWFKYKDQNMNITEQEWIDSQQHESGFWSTQIANNNEEQFHRWGWYSQVCFPGYFRRKSFSGLAVADVGSGPRGILHHISAGLKVAIDPLMDDFKAKGHPVSDNGVTPYNAAIEEMDKHVGKTFDVVFCLNCLDHCRDVSVGMDQLAKLIKPNGDLVICVDMRHPDDLDSLHKIRITDEFMRAELNRIGIIFHSWHVPHQAPTRTIQFCAIGKK